MYNKHIHSHSYSCRCVHHTTQFRSCFWIGWQGGCILLLQSCVLKQKWVNLQFTLEILYIWATGLRAKKSLGAKKTKQEKEEKVDERKAIEKEERSENKQGSRSARLSPQSMIHYARKLFKCSIRIVRDFTILETTK